MNKTEIKRAIEAKQKKKILEMDKEHKALQKKLEQNYIENTVAVELSEVELSLDKIKVNRDFNNFTKALRAMVNKVNSTPNLNHFNSYAKKELIRYLELMCQGNFEVDVYTSYNSYSGEESQHEAYKEYLHNVSQVNKEYTRLLAYLKTVTAKVFMEHMKEIGITLTVEDNQTKEKLQLPAPNFNVGIFK